MKSVPKLLLFHLNEIISKLLQYLTKREKYRNSE